MIKKLLFVLLAVLVGYVFYVLYSTGFFRTIENDFAGRTLAKIEIPGVEDITVDREDHFAVFISYDRAAERDGRDFTTGIYFMELDTTTFTPVLLSDNFNKPLLPHGISLIKVDSNRHKLFVINHAAGEFIEVFDLYDRDSLVHRQSLAHELIYSPNDIVAINERQFYFTNDSYYSHNIGKLAENYLEVSRCETVYFDGENYRIVDNSLSYANGINYDAERKLLYVAGVRNFVIKVFQKQENGDLKHLSTIDCGTGVDNIELDENGHVWVGCHPNLVASDRFIRGKAKQSPSELIRIDYRGPVDYDQETIYLNDGREMSASTVAATYENLILVGNVCDEHFLVLER